MSKAPQFSVILAAGKGTRMGSESCPKVCFPVDGKPAINRAIDIYNRCGVTQHIVVVGAMAGHVVETVGREFSNVQFVYQAEQRGTAHAARIGLAALQSLSHDAEVLLVPGDRIVEPSVLEQLFDGFASSGADLALLTAQKGTGSGRVVLDVNGDVLGVVEALDIRQRNVFRQILESLRKGVPMAREELVSMMRDTVPGHVSPAAESKLKRAFGPMWEAAVDEARQPTEDELSQWIPEDRTHFVFVRTDGTSVELTPDEIEASSDGNVSIYMAKFTALYSALQNLSRDNAQQEEYLTDVVSILGARNAEKPASVRTLAVPVANENDVLGYNDPAELLEVEEIIRSRTKQGITGHIPESLWFRSLKEWRQAFDQDSDKPDSDLLTGLRTAYGSDPDVLDDRLQSYKALLSYAETILDAETSVFIVRSPGRVNVMGRHVDHQGGNCNLMTIGFETLIVVCPREDDRIRLFNVDEKHYSNADFGIGELVADLPWDDWLSVVNSEKVGTMIKNYGGHWSQYVMAAALRLQKKFSHSPLRGMDLIVSGNIPPAAGLSSSSSLVVGAADSIITRNQLSTAPIQLVDLCGEGEWFVGTRGGSADHAAVKLGKRGNVIKVTFFEFAVQDTVPFPKDHVMLVCDSGIRAQKSGNAKNQFNHRISCYQLGFKLIQAMNPQYEPLLHYLRDVNTETLGVPLSWIYKILLRLPESVNREELQEMLPDEDLEPLFVTHAPPEDGLYPIRGVVLFGLAEFDRSAKYADLLKASDIQTIGKMMNTSHNGDRVASFSVNGQETLYTAPTSDAYILGLIEDLESGEPDRVLPAQLSAQPGSYHCSLPCIDHMVDIALQTDGVAGAQLAGAGLGGCLMVFCHRDAVAEVRRSLTEQYYDLSNKPSVVLACHPIAGAGVLMEQEKE